MEFIVQRTSDWSVNKPLNNAYLKQVENYDERTISTFDQFDERVGHMYGKFTSKGRGHKIYSNGRIQRTLDWTEWCVNINDLNQLLKLSKIKGDIIIKYDLDYNFPVLEIYDSYRE
ncbi:hypothetical protein AABD41_01615 [Staphylococcus pseudoxylosus]|uniref:hypothetical protein n=1 Tax=Staphylococcus pseudoxylosus TaxID=2282419 RepID=UPI00398B7F25